MSDPAADVQRAVYAALAAALAGAPVGGRVYDRVPESAEFPYVTISDAQVIEDGAACIDGSECFVDIHIWSRAVGMIEAKEIAGTIRGALHEAALDLGDDHEAIEAMFQDGRYLRDPDGLTTHAVLTFRLLTEAVS